MKFIISGHDSIGVLNWEKNSLEIRQMPASYVFNDARLADCNQPIRTFGITWDQNSLFLASHEKIGVLDHSLKHVRFLEISPLWFMTHNLTYDRGVLYSCNSRVDIIGMHNLIEGCEQFFHVAKNQLVVSPQDIKPLLHGYRYDYNHPNAILVTKGEIYILVHYMAGDSFKSEIRVLEKNTLTIKERFVINIHKEYGFFLHDLALNDGVFYWNNTHSCRVENSLGEISDKLGGPSTFLRGLAMNQDTVFVGLATRKQHFVRCSDMWIIQLDSRTLSVIEKRQIDFQVEICALRLLDEFDFGHWNEFQFDLELRQKA